MSYEIVNNKEFMSKERSLIIVGCSAVRIDRENMQLYFYDIVDLMIDISSVGILMEVSSEYALKIESKLGISVEDYGVRVINEEPIVMKL